MIAELRTFAAIARYGTFAKAADKVGLTQAAVSAQIKRLEDHLAMTLFDRTGRSALLNADGARLLPRVQALLVQFDSLRDADVEAATGTLRLGSIAAVQSTILARALITFRQRFSEYRVPVFTGLSLALVDQVDSGEMDLAILIRPPFGLPPDLVWHSLGSEPYVLIAPPACPGEDWREVLESQKFLRYNRLSTGGRLVNGFLRSLPFTVRDAMELPLRTMLPMVRGGMGVALVPLSELHRHPSQDLRVFPLHDQALVRETGFIVSRSVESEVAASFMAECLVQAAGQELPWMDHSPSA